MNTTNQCSITIQPATTADLDKVFDTILHYNSAVMKSMPPIKIHRADFSAVNQKGEFVGGIKGKWTSWGTLEVELLAVSDGYRRQGIGSMLLRHVEGIAQANNCYIAQLDTFEFQAKDFYLKHGYSVFGVLSYAPKEYCRYYMKKELSPTSSS